MSLKASELIPFEPDFKDRISIGLKNFYELYGDSTNTPHLVRSPGRAEGIGNHTDYNRLDSVGICIGNSCLVFARIGKKPGIHIYSSNFKSDGIVSLNLNNIIRDTDRKWTNYALAVAREFISLDLLRPELAIEMYVDSTVPLTGGVSSSASFELAIAKSIDLLTGSNTPPIQLALLCQRAENSDLVQSPCGLLDQATIALGGVAHLKFGLSPLEDGFATQINFNHSNLPADFIITVDPTSKRNLGTSGYPIRRAVCEIAYSVLKQTFFDLPFSNLESISEEQIIRNKDQIIKTALEQINVAINSQDKTIDRTSFPLLSNLTGDALDNFIATNLLQDLDIKEVSNKLANLVPLRMLHILGEHRRVQEFVSALKAGNCDAIGKLFKDSGDSGIHYYELDEGCPQLTTLIKACRGELKTSSGDKTLLDYGNLGSRNMGGGHSANVLSIVKRGMREHFEYALTDIYKSYHGKNAKLEFIHFNPSPGLSEILIS